jgi:hypothetical protein
MDENLVQYFYALRNWINFLFHKYSKRFFIFSEVMVQKNHHPLNQCDNYGYNIVISMNVANFFICLLDLFVVY